MNSNFLAVVGLAGRFPGAASVEPFWANLASGVESISLVGAGRFFGVLDGAEEFDAGFFGFSPLEALTLDPQHRLLLECAVEALEHAGYDPHSYPGAIGVYAGSSQTAYLEALHARRAAFPSTSEYQLRLATGMDFLTTRLTYRLNLRGPAVTVQTACSTSLVAIHLAGQALLAGECDIALAGGVCAHVPPPPDRTSEGEGGILAPDGRCRAFDAEARGTVGGNAVGLVVLKRLDDALADGDHVHVVMRGSAVNNDGAGKIGYTAPSVEGQARAVRTALDIAGVEAQTVGYVEAHGTGTPLGDPIEIAALTRAFRADTDRRQFCLIGSVKTNIGHTDAAAGVAGFIKTVLALERGMVPPSLNFTKPNPECAFPRSPFAVNTELQAWPLEGHPRRAGVSSFGIGGTNAHVVLEEAPARDPSVPGRPHQLLVLSAKTPSALEAVTRRLAAHLAAHPEEALADVAWTLQVGRQAHAHRQFVVAASHDVARQALGPGGPRLPVRGVETATPSIVFLFPGQGGQHVGMARELYENEPVFREVIDECCALAAGELGLDLRDVLYPVARDGTAAERLGTMSIGQPAVFIVEYALARLWMHWGVVPAAVAGHSLGAYAAASIAGVFSLPDALRLVVERGRLLQRVPAGAMLAVPLPEAELRPRLGVDLGVAAVNSALQTVVSGPAAAVDALRDRLERDGVEARRLRISVAGHSKLVEPVLEALRAAASGVPMHAPTVPWVSDMTGRWVSADETPSPDYWTEHLRRPVRFADVLETVLAAPGRALLELGPGHTLATLARQHPARSLARLVVPSLPHPTERTSSLASMLEAAGRLWLAGARIAWPSLHDGQPRRRVALPTYPFERRRYALEQPVPLASPRGLGVVAAVPAASGADPVPARFPRPDTGTPYRKPQSTVERRVAAAFAEVLGIRKVGIDDNFFELGGDSLIAARLVARLRSVALDVRVREVVEAPTAGQLAALIAGRKRKTAAHSGAASEGDGR